MKHLLYLLYGTAFLLVALGFILIMAFAAQALGIMVLAVPIGVFLAYGIGRMVHDVTRGQFR
jgi:uncharacterized membrane protein (DUF485 family)